MSHPADEYWRPAVYDRWWKLARNATLSPAQVESPLARRVYDLRHAAASLWLNAGVPPTEVARRLGHSVAVLTEGLRELHRWRRRSAQHPDRCTAQVTELTDRTWVMRRWSRQLIEGAVPTGVGTAPLTYDLSGLLPAIVLARVNELPWSALGGGWHGVALGNCSFVAALRGSVLAALRSRFARIYVRHCHHLRPELGHTSRPGSRRETPELATVRTFPSSGLACATRRTPGLLALERTEYAWLSAGTTTV